MLSHVRCANASPIILQLKLASGLEAVVYGGYVRNVYANALMPGSWSHNTCFSFDLVATCLTTRSYISSCNSHGKVCKGSFGSMRPWIRHNVNHWQVHLSRIRLRWCDFTCTSWNFHGIPPWCMRLTAKLSFATNRVPSKNSKLTWLVSHFIFRPALNNMTDRVPWT